MSLESKVRGRLKQKRAKSPFFEGQGESGKKYVFTFICLKNRYGVDFLKVEKLFFLKF